MKLDEAHRALAQGDELPLFRWLRESTPKFRAAAHRIAARYGVTLRAHEVDDAEALGWSEAWRAVEGFRFYCPRCRAEDARFGSKLSRGFATERGLRQHALRVHGEPLPAPSIDRRVWYLIGSAMQSYARRVRREREREHLSFVIEGLDEDACERVAAAVAQASEPTGMTPIEVVELRHSLAEIADPVQRGLAARVLAGVPFEDAMRMVSY